MTKPVNQLFVIDLVECHTKGCPLVPIIMGKGLNKVAAQFITSFNIYRTL